MKKQQVMSYIKISVGMSRIRKMMVASWNPMAFFSSRLWRRAFKQIYDHYIMISDLVKRTNSVLAALVFVLLFIGMLSHIVLECLFFKAHRVE